jgi:hypothetical protein
MDDITLMQPRHHRKWRRHCQTHDRVGEHQIINRQQTPRPGQPKRTDPPLEPGQGLHAHQTGQGKEQIDCRESMDEQ